MDLRRNKITPMVGDQVWAIITDYSGKEVWSKRLQVNLVRGQVEMPEPPREHQKDGNIYHTELRQPDGNRYILKSYKLRWPDEDV